MPIFNKTIQYDIILSKDIWEVLKISNSINIAICDDEKVQVELLEKYVDSWAKIKNRRVNIERFYSGDAFQFHWSMDKGYDVLLLDIEMPGIDGVKLAKKIREEDEGINIIFITAITDYIGEGYNVSAINYLIKPIKEKKLYECLDRAVDKISKEEKYILLEVDKEVIRIKERDILSIESFSHYIEVNTLHGKYTTRKNIGAMEKELDEDAFVRCHRSYIVSNLHIKRIGKEEIELDNGNMIPVSRRRYSKINMKFIEYFRGGIDELR